MLCYSSFLILITTMSASFTYSTFTMAIVMIVVPTAMPGMARLDRSFTRRPGGYMRGFTGIGGPEYRPRKQ